MSPFPTLSRQVLADGRANRATAIARAGSLTAARERGVIPPRVDLTHSEALVLGLPQQDVRIFFAVFGHGSTELTEGLRIYQQAGLLRVLAVRSEIKASHAAAALRWMRDEKAAVVTSIGPGARQAMAASLVPASDGLGMWYLYGDETTEDEGFNTSRSRATSSVCTCAWRPRSAQPTRCTRPLPFPRLCSAAQPQ